MNHDLSLVTLMMNASWVVQAVVLILVLGSIASWTAIIEKVSALKRVRALNDDFEKTFRSGASLSDVFHATVENEAKAGPLERVFASGMSEYQKLHEGNVSDPGTLVEVAGRAMRTASRRELDSIETRLPFLATLGSIAPYVGLFGTVWGIMHAFTGLATLEQISLASVAPGIAEALIATALGLFTAIPAVVAYNRFSHQIDQVAILFEVFAEDFSNILQRSLLTTGSAAAAISTPSRKG
jgi:biopolymer transport protein TolQ